MEEHNNSEGLMMLNQGANDGSALRIRLETKELLQQIEFFLRGLEPNEFYDKESQSYQIKLMPMGDPKLNKPGIQAILNRCRALINPHVVQGNFEKDFYFKLIGDIRREISTLLFINKYRWEMKNRSDIKEITDTIMNVVEPFLSRTIGNKERDSYTSTMRTVESNTVGKSGFNLPFLGRKD